MAIRRFGRDTLQGFVNPASYIQPEILELLSTSGSVVSVPYYEVKAVLFVKEFDVGEETGKIFNTRPKMDGLWVRMTFRDGEIMDGILPNDLLQWNKEGYSVIPPEPYANNQKIFVPREALKSLTVLGVVGSALQKNRRSKTVSEKQIELFEP